MARQVDMAYVLQSESALHQQQRHLKGDAIVAVVHILIGRPFGYAQGVVGVGVGDPVLGRLINAYAVVVQDGDACDCE